MCFIYPKCEFYYKIIIAPKLVILTYDLILPFCRFFFQESIKGGNRLFLVILVVCASTTVTNLRPVYPLRTARSPCVLQERTMMCFSSPDEQKATVLFLFWPPAVSSNFHCDPEPGWISPFCIVPSSLVCLSSCLVYC